MRVTIGNIKIRRALRILGKKMYMGPTIGNKMKNHPGKKKNTKVTQRYSTHPSSRFMAAK